MDAVQILQIAAPLGAAAAVLIGGGRWIGRLEKTSESLEAAMLEWKRDREKLEALPVLSLRVATLEAAVTEHGSRIAALWDKMMSTRVAVAAIRARSASRPDLVPDGGEEG